MPVPTAPKKVTTEDVVAKDESSEVVETNEGKAAPSSVTPENAEAQATPIEPPAAVEPEPEFEDDEEKSESYVHQPELSFAKSDKSDEPGA